MSNSNVQINLTGEVAFPQPIAPESYKRYERVWVCGADNSVWQNSKAEGYAEAGRAYLTEAEAVQRLEWDAQQMRRLVIPAWFRALGPDVEFLPNGEWTPYLHVLAAYPDDWSKVNPANFRARPRDVVVTVNGKEYRWPETVRRNEPHGQRFVVSMHDGALLWHHSDTYGPTVHHTRAGAEQQLAAIRAAAGVVA